MQQVISRTVMLVALALLLLPSVSGAQASPSKSQYQPLSNGEMSQQGLWDAWVTEFNALNGKQKAEVVRRHVKMCLDSFELTNEQRAFITETTAKFVTEEAYGETDPAKRAAIQQEMQPVLGKAMALLGPELAMRVFGAKPPISVVFDVKNDAKFK
jgi:hypothetical protein